jgi:AraC family transcriptional regulator
VVFPHHEHVSKLRSTVETISNEWLPRSGYEVVWPPDGIPNFFERYGEAFDPGTGRGDVEVWIPIKS